MRLRRTALRTTAAVAAAWLLAGATAAAADRTPVAAGTAPSAAAGTASPVAVAPPLPAIYAGADLALGAKLIAEHRCAACHARKFGGDGSAIYRPKGRIDNPGALRGMVEQCNSELNLQLFPDEVTSVAAVLNRDHYKFK